MKSIIRVLGIVSKEIREVFRQPSLMLVLILGPFLILLLFGLGHSAVQPPLRTALVVPRGVELPVPPEQYQELLGSTMRLVATSDDPTTAIEQLNAHEVELVVVIPVDLYERLRAGEQAVVTVLFDEIDPVMTNYIRFVAAAQMSEMNRKILEAALRQAVQPAGPLDQFAAVSGQELAALQRDLAAGDTVSAKQRIARLDAIAATLDARLEALSRFLQPTGPEGGLQPTPQQVGNTRAALAKFRADLATLNQDIDAGSPDTSRDVEQARADAATVTRAASGLAEVPAQVITAPLASRTENVAPVEPDFVAFFAPAVLALLLQHIAVTFGSLSIVRERLYGAMELFRVAPVSAMQVLLGKYFAYLLLGLAITAASTALIVRELDVPFNAAYDYFAAVIAALILASLDIGFCISLLSSSERQAVQLAMLTLIASVFFSGFFLRLESFRWPIRAISYLLPVTYGIETLQDSMLRGRNDDYQSLAALVALTVALFIAAVWLLGRELGRAQGGQAGAD